MGQRTITNGRVLGIVHGEQGQYEKAARRSRAKGLADHWSESYVSKTGKSMKGVELTVSQRDC